MAAKIPNCTLLGALRGRFLLVLGGSRDYHGLVTTLSHQSHTNLIPSSCHAVTRHSPSGTILIPDSWQSLDFLWIAPWCSLKMACDLQENGAWWSVNVMRLVEDSCCHPVIMKVSTSLHCDIHSVHSTGPCADFVSIITSTKFTEG